MKRLFLISILFARSLSASQVPILTLSDTVNPGTADYVVTQVDAAERSKAPYLIIEMDTPGGLLNSTRTIVQKMLNSSIPIVVFISPKGAHAGSAGALITLAADVAAMAPGTNIGAAHPVAPGSEKLEKTMEDKITNDTAAFAESLAKAKGRNTEVAAQMVRKSTSLIAEEALKQGVVDLIAEDMADLTSKLRGWKLKVPKATVTALPQAEVIKVPSPMSIKQRLVSFFSDPNIAYLILSLGALCIWIELSHPGLVLPAVIGGICIVLSLISFQTLPIHYGALAMILLGFILIIAELFVPAFGSLGIGGIVCFVLGSLFLMDTNAPEFQISLKIILPTAAVLASFAFLLSVVVFRSRNLKLQSGLEALVGTPAEVKETVTASSGMVFVNGALWKAVSKNNELFDVGHKVVVVEVRGMLLVVQA
ncbi:MAG: nodulation protein NfeD [Deltaproteobacteria bacterium]|nr:nodulation protein NfeD [Deltaproteobacteria bacterium]